MDRQQAKTAGATNNYQAALHSVQQKQLAKTWRRPDHQSPAPKVYQVDPRGFRDLVQQLTGSAASPPLIRSQPLRDTARVPPPLCLAPRPAEQEYNAEAADSLEVGGGADGGANSTGFMDLLSPSFFSAWWPLHGEGLEA